MGLMINVVISVFMSKVHGAKSNLPSIMWERNDVIKSLTLFVRHFTTTEPKTHAKANPSAVREQQTRSEELRLPGVLGGLIC